MFAFPDRKRSLGAPDLRRYDIYGIAFKLFFNSGGSRPSDNEGGGSHLDPEIRGGLVSQKNFLALRASFWSENKEGHGPPEPLPWIRHCTMFHCFRVVTVFSGKF